MVDELGEEERLCRVLADLRGVVGVDRLRRRIGSPGAGASLRAEGLSEAKASVRSIIRVVPSVCAKHQNPTGWTEEWEVLGRRARPAKFRVRRAF